MQVHTSHAHLYVHTSHPTAGTGITDKFSIVFYFLFFLLISNSAGQCNHDTTVDLSSHACRPHCSPAAATWTHHPPTSASTCRPHRLARLQHVRHQHAPHRSTPPTHGFNVCHPNTPPPTRAPLTRTAPTCRLAQLRNSGTNTHCIYTRHLRRAWPQCVPPQHAALITCRFDTHLRDERLRLVPH
jgi:hypothetical protein